jgi:hypothetical protein
MKSLTLYFLLLSTTCFAQINAADSTVQVIAYWDKGQQENYVVSTEKYKINGKDTTGIERVRYDVQMTVLEEDEKTYTLEWRYKNIVVEHPDPVMQRLMNLSQNMRVVFTTDELGGFKEVINHEEMQRYITKAAEGLRAEFPSSLPYLEQVTKTYSSKEAIESVSIKDVHQFLTFHGGKFKLNEVIEGATTMPNVFGPEPFDGRFRVYLEEFDEEEDDFVMNATEAVNSEQLTEATFQYLVRMANNMNIAPPKKEEIGQLRNEIITRSRIFGSGWVSVSVQSSSVFSGDRREVEIRRIELQ